MVLTYVECNSRGKAVISAMQEMATFGINELRLIFIDIYFHLFLYYF